MDYATLPPLFLKADRFGVRLGLERMQSLMAYLGNPQDKLSCFHVAGTNGKGSVCNFIAHLLCADGHRVGLFTSPYLERFSERIRVLDLAAGHLNENSEIGSPDFFKLSKTVEKAVEMMLLQGNEHPTEFELLTALAFLYFEKMACDYVVLETGLGGRLDSTNIVAKPNACVITMIAYDHMDRLGDTIESIATEKAGIIKPDVPVYLYDPHASGLSDADAIVVERVMAKRCREKKADLYRIGPQDVSSLNVNETGQSFSLKLAPMTLSMRLLGSYQLVHAALAAQAVYPYIRSESLRAGFLNATWPGRLEILLSSPLILLDCAHNVAGLRRLCEEINTLFKPSFHTKNPPIVVLGVLSDKDVDGMLDALFFDPLFSCASVVCVAPENKRALLAIDLKEKVQRVFLNRTMFYNRQAHGYNRQGEITACKTIAKAMKKAITLAKKSQVSVLCTGSIFLAGPVRSYVNSIRKE